MVKKKEEEQFEKDYKKLNLAQKEAVDTTEGPVMVVAGPGTGKTQILALRIANILKETDIKADGILCLTFTNSGVSAMKERLRKYIGAASSRVSVSTFHSFGMKIIEEHYGILGFDVAPKLMDEADTIMLCDEILHNHEWEYLRPRSDVSRYFSDLKSLISLLKRERISPEDFLVEIEKGISNLKDNSENISTRGESKGQLKKEIVKKIEGLGRTREVVKFFELYEKAKREKNKKNVLFDYDDVLEYLVKIVEEDDDVRADIQEKYLYVLIDEHQDSSGIQNEFLQKVWGGVEKPNIFVVGDDRQLIYGFGGASLQYFEGFKHSFGKAKLITLIDNYRSTQVILDASELLLQSSLSKEKLISHSKETHPIRLVECDYPRDEIIACALDIKEKIEKGLNPNNCAILVPKNKQVRSAVAILRDMNLPVSAYGAARLFDAEDTELLLRILKIISDPYDNVALAESFFDKSSGIDPLFAHKFIKEHDMKNLSLINLSEERTPTLFREDNTVSNWIKKLLYFLKESQTRNVYSLIQLIGDEFLIGDAKDHNTLISRIEIIRTMLHLALSQIEKNPKLTLKEFLSFMERLYSYDENIPLAVFNADEGIKVLTLHSSKGLEFDFVWIAHMDERSLNSQKKQGFTLPESIKERLETRDEEVIKRQLYVAITRAKRFCTISYALHSYTGGDQELAHVVADLPESIFKKETSRETEQAILEHNPRAYTGKFLLDKETSNANIKPFNLVALTDIVSKEYVKRNVSVSLLNNFFECPWKWYFRNLLQLPGMKSESLEFGNAVHACIDRILKIKNKLTKLELEKIVEGEILKREFGDDKNQKQRQKEVFNIVSKWVENRLPQIKLERENEKSISIKDDKFSHLSIYGKIDLVEKLDSNNVRVTDFKTGSVRKKSEIEKEDEEGRMSGYLRQLAMYSYLIRESTKQKVDVRESRLEFLEAKDEKEAIFDRVIGDKEIVLLIKDIVDYDSLIKSGKWVERECHYNSYGKNSECEYCKMAKMYTEIYK